jgi:hypothetical protein
VAAIVLAGNTSAVAATRCGTLACGEYKLYISKKGKVTCSKARRLVSRFRIEERRVKHGDGTLATTYWTIPGFPGWRCGSGSGGGGCGYKSGRRTRVDFEIR